MSEPNVGRTPSARVADAATELHNLFPEAKEADRDEDRAYHVADLSDAAIGPNTEVVVIEKARMVAMNNRVEFSRDGMEVEFSA